jgi:hypothetical protein
MTISSIDIFEEKKCIYNVSSTQEFTHTGTCTPVTLVWSVPVLVITNNVKDIYIRLWLAIGKFMIYTFIV